jgi:hypothetical protein
VLVRGARTGCYVDGAGRGRPRPPAPPARFYRRTPRSPAGAPRPQPPGASQTRRPACPRSRVSRSALRRSAPHVPVNYTYDTQTDSVPQAVVLCAILCPGWAAHYASTNTLPPGDGAVHCTGTSETKMYTRLARATVHAHDPNVHVHHALCVCTDLWAIVHVKMHGETLLHELGAGLLRITFPRLHLDSLESASTPSTSRRRYIVVGRPLACSKQT